MKNIRDRLYLSTIADNAPDLAKQHGLGIELCQFCDTARMEPLTEETDGQIRRCLSMSERFVMHAPFAELSPATIDPMILTAVKKRFRQAALLAQRYGVRRMVVHSGYIPLVYFKEWFIPRSVSFWQEFIAELPNDFELLLENVMDDEPFTLKKIVDEVSDPRFRLCLDVGHLNVISKHPAEEWISHYGNSLAHVHLHNNHKDWDTHNHLYDGTLDIPEIVEQSLDTSPDITFTLELIEDASPSVNWLLEKGIL